MKRMFTHAVANLRRSDAGTAAIEFAIIATVMIVTSVGIVEFGRGLYLYNKISYAADVVARQILLKNNITDAALTEEARKSFSSVDKKLLQVQTSLVGTQYRKIEISYPFGLMVPYFGTHRISFKLTREVPLINPPT